MMEAYVDALVREIASHAGVGGAPGRRGLEKSARSTSQPSGLLGSDGAPSGLSTIYFGGGTPSLVSIRSLDRILRALRDRFGGDVAQEINDRG